MTSDAQIRANQANAQLSTGPTSSEGKARSARNNLRHGFQSQSVLLPGDDPAEYQALLDDLNSHFHPSELTQLRCVREMADAEWRLRRARLYQEELLTAQIDQLRPGHPEASAIQLQMLAYDTLLRESRFFAQLSRFETRFQNQYNRARRDCETDQRLLAKTAAPAPAIPRDVTDEPNSSAETPRSAPCPCGSGLKYKRCCGRQAPPQIHQPAPRAA